METAFGLIVDETIPTLLKVEFLFKIFLAFFNIESRVVFPDILYPTKIRPCLTFRESYNYYTFSIRPGEDM